MEDNKRLFCLLYKHEKIYTFYFNRFFLIHCIYSGIQIEGEILDKSNNSVLAFANIILDGSALGAASDSDGRFIIEKIKPGSYTVIASYMGYSTYKKEITIPYVSDTNELIIFLEPEAIQLDEYVVTASRRRERIEDAPAAISVISKKKYEERAIQILEIILKARKE